MTTNNSGVKYYKLMSGYDSMMRKVNQMQESGDGVYVRFDDYEALQAECERLRKDADTERQPVPDMSTLAEILREAATIIEAIHPEFAPRNMRWSIIDELEGFALMLDIADGWTPTNGKKPDLPVDTLIDVKFANGVVDTIHNADLWRWTHEGVANDITHYRIHHTVSSVQEEPVGWQFYQNGKWQYGDDHIKDHRKNTEEAGIPVRDVYAAPQPEAVDGACAVAAIQFALTDQEGMTFLRLWNEGEFDTLRREWPDAPSEVYVGADPLYTKHREPTT